MNNNKAGSASGCLGMIVVFLLFKWLLPESLEWALVGLLVASIIVIYVYMAYDACYESIVKVKLKYLNRQFKDVDDSVKSQEEYIDDDELKNVSIDKRISYLQCICKQVKGMQDESIQVQETQEEGIQVHETQDESAQAQDIQKEDN